MVGVLANIKETLFAWAFVSGRRRGGRPGGCGGGGRDQRGQHACVRQRCLLRHQPCGASSNGNGAAQVAKRPYINSRFLIDMIIKSSKPTADTIMPGALRWEVAGTFNGSKGIYELVIDPATNRILHFLFRSVR